jgi:hypothetical protein
MEKATMKQKVESMDDGREAMKRTKIVVCCNHESVVRVSQIPAKFEVT